ncbi:MAG: NUDIX domain-containing protein [Bacteroidetes bacterium]|nr:NUDIX domain-containing protein [Bacteroidota bacterium]
MNTKEDRSIGIIIYHLISGSPEFLIIKHKQGHWSFAKGHKESGETEIQTAVRELKEETGISDVKFLSENIELSESYSFNAGRNFKIQKTVDYFIAEVFIKEINIDRKEIVDFKWCDPDSAVKLLTYTDSGELLIKAYNKILNKHEINSK